MENENVPAKQEETGLATQQNAVAIPENFGGFSEEEALGGMSPAVAGYLKSFPYFVRTDNGTFEIRDNASDEVVVADIEKIEKAIVYYGHQTWRLKQGHITGAQGDESDWSDDDKQIVAVSYDAKSKGNFDHQEFGQYMTKDYKDLHKKLKRVYIFFIAPGLNMPNRFGIIGGSFGISTLKGFSALRQEVDRLTFGNGQKANIPLPFVTCDIGFVKEKNESGKSYNRVVFTMRKKENGLPEFAFSSPDEYRKSDIGLKNLKAIIDTHHAARAAAENNEIDMGFGNAEKTVDGFADISDTSDTDETPTW